MFERFRKPKVQAIAPDVIPKHIMPNREEIISMGYSAKEKITEFLKALSRTELMDFQDSKQFDGTKAEDASWEAANDVEWGHEYPIGEHGYKERIPSIVNDTIAEYKLGELKKQVDGIQKKMDRVIYLIENAEFTIKGKEAMKL